MSKKVETTTVVLVLSTKHTAWPKLQKYLPKRLQDEGFTVSTETTSSECHMQVSSESAAFEQEDAASDEWLWVGDKMKHGSRRIQLIWDRIDALETGPDFEERTSIPTIHRHIPMLRALRRAGALLESVHFHDEKLKKGIFQEFLKFRSMFSLPVNEIQSYYGDQVAFYFAWMEHYITWLMFPAMLGSAIWMLSPEGMSVDNHPLVPFFSILVALWAALFLKFWKRRTASLASSWGTFSDQNKKRRVRPSFYGTIRTSPITGQPERYYPAIKRMTKQFISLIITVLLLSIAVAVMVCSLNLQGYIHDKSSPFYVSQLNRYSQPGEMFDPEGNFWMAPTVLHSIVIFVINQVYRTIAEELTEWENYRTEAEHENSIIIKRFCFEAFDCYLPLFYIAFYQLNVVNLRRELLSLYTADEFRRVITETLIPYVSEKFAQRKKSSAAGKGKKDETTPPSNAEEEIALGEAELFDDYLEMVIQFGYVTLFAAAFPLAGAISVASNILEARSDMFKLTYAYRRPRPIRASGIGSWHTVMEFMCWVSVPTNCLIFGFSSHQIIEWFPSLFDDGEMKLGMGRYVIGIVVGMEHLVVVLVLVLSWLISDVPEDVDTKYQRIEYEKESALLKQRFKSKSG